MNPETGLLIDKGDRSLAAAEVLFAKGDYDFAASRAYYAMFYLAEAALLEKGKTFSKHTGVIDGFYHEFVATGRVSRELHHDLHVAFEDRVQGDYAFLDPFPKEDAEILLKKAEEFVNEVKRQIDLCLTIKKS